LAAINALADGSPGFVWRFQTPEGDAAAAQDPRMLLNISVWESVEALRQFTYNSDHSGPLRERAKWFEKPAGAHLAMWWIPAGHIPTEQEAFERLEFRRVQRDTAVAFSFAAPYPAPDEPDGEPVEPELNYDNRLFIPAANTPNGDTNTETQFLYRQQGARVWATYRGGPVHFGSLVAIGDRQGRLDMRYQHVDAQRRLRTGKCTATPEILPDGRLRLHEEWQWTNGDFSQGRSVVEEYTLSS
jgi:hypothetical protein